VELVRQRGNRLVNETARGEDRLARFRGPALRKHIRELDGGALRGQIVQELQFRGQTRGVPELLFLQPEFVPDGYRSARSLTGANFADLVRIAKVEGWPGYFG
jgi:hypothetical protein